MTQNNSYTDDFMQASEYLRMVLPFLSKYKIPASPLNYQIGYDFMSGNNTALKKALDSYLEKSAGLSEKMLVKLYKQYSSQNDGEALDTIRQELLKIINNIQSEYDNSSGELSDYLTSLNSFVDQLSGSKEQSEMAKDTQKVIDDTRSTELNQRKFDSQMDCMMDEMQSLRQQLDKVKEESLTDALTSLANRKAFDQMLNLQIQQYTEQNSPFCLVIADIDFFKKFNDIFGHLVGDKVLRYVGKTIKSCVKGKDMAARFGGEEFVLVLPETDIKGAEIVAEHVRVAISKSALIDHNSNEKYGKITISLGISQFQKGELPNDLIKRADQALYKAKENGRNRVEKAA